jgi:hypothetical protein
MSVYDSYNIVDNENMCPCMIMRLSEVCNSYTMRVSPVTPLFSMA